MVGWPSGGQAATAAKQHAHLEISFLVPDSVALEGELGCARPKQERNLAGSAIALCHGAGMLPWPLFLLAALQAQGDLEEKKGDCSFESACVGGESNKSKSGSSSIDDLT